MKLSDFKKELREIGGDFDRVKELLLEEYIDTATIESIIDNIHFTEDVLLSLANIDTYCMKLYHKAVRRTMIANYDEVVPYAYIRRRGDDWMIGHHTLNKKRRKKLFKLLAEDLGYEIEG